ncbi:DCC1-like thiol-disulfide oxidoreductase family protein [Caldalkalibacillus mannanilyticus]|uniref:DCC1-like thiol-disulfide oxidoreductase family protein n=1 Tax=Caldalkalibacillus mannanilyticus TaxID=1418 RepID=UPI000469CC14|nr:DCC1-like thiol-disulfide oxidoreductase family protein [Caldalkalibacillus mannanilyticus]
MLGVNMKNGYGLPLVEKLSQERFLIGASLTRICFGLVILYTYLIHYNQRLFLWSPNGVMTHEEYLHILSMTGSISLYQFSDSLAYFNFIYHLGIIVSLLYIIGYKGRVVSVLQFIFFWSLLDRTVLISDGGDNILRLMLFYLMFANNTAYFSLDSIHFKSKRSERKHQFKYQLGTIFHNVAILLCIIQLCLMYVASGLYQVMGEMWNNGTAVYYILQVEQFSSPFFRHLLLQSDFLIVVFTYLSILVKIAFPFLLFNRVTKYVVVFGAVGFHFGIAIGMGLLSFSFIMISIDLLLFSDREYRNIKNYYLNTLKRIKLGLKWKGRRLGNDTQIRKKQLYVFYDGWCPMCIKSVERIHRFDWFRLIKFKSFRDEKVAVEYGIDLQRAEERMLCKKLSGTVISEGIDSFIEMSKRVPIMWLILPVLLLARLCGVGQKLYDYIASRRTIIPSSHCDEQCLIQNDIAK